MNGQNSYKHESDFRKVAGYKVNIRKCTVFLNTRNKPEIENLKTMLYYNVIKTNEVLRDRANGTCARSAQ